ncbi:phage tail tape measure protein [Ralstonia solanacearum]|nr:phage tail tape measure protein [Ralstonia solanacearum FJAT-1458]QKL71505.1 phage tail tape measure protein [Ralstonia solanacearum]QKL76714.1 phage tail tape measure protein [Ralstonia solanacearum]QKL81918.1 phage tail tape measure protein [Ralstonia solanacearum]QKL87129.1 phage tail tape measure protein [Ralstonia solanacearum]
MAEAVGNAVVGKATLVVDADATGVKAGMGEARTSVVAFETVTATSGKKSARNIEKIGEAATSAAGSMDAAASRFLKSLERQADRAGKTAAEYAALRAEQLGVSQAASQYIERMRVAEVATKAADTSTQNLGMSARQTAATMRMVAPQMTDIVTQLAGGQSPLLVLTQQGGQLKDMFGGIGPALKGVGSYVAGLITPTTLAAGAAAALAFAWSTGAQEARGYTNALIMTGHYAGVSSAQLAGMAEGVSRIIGTQHAAADVLSRLTATGRVASEQMSQVAVAAIAMEKATGQSVDETIRDFVKLAEEPTKASVKLNEQFHYLTGAVYEQIAALERAGQTDEAAALAQKTYAAALADRAMEVRRNVGYMEMAWVGLTDAAKKAWDAVAGIGRAETPADKLNGLYRAMAQQEKELAEARAKGYNTVQLEAALGANRAKLQQYNGTVVGDAKKAADQAAKQRAEDDRISARSSIDALMKSVRSRQQIRDDELKKFKTDADKAGLTADEYARGVAAINEKYKDKSSKAYTEDAGTRMLEQLRRTGAALAAQQAVDEQLTAGQKARAEFEQQIADIKTRKTLTADQKSLLAHQDEIRAQLDLNVAAEQAIQKRKDETAELEKQRKLLEDARQQAEGMRVRIADAAQARSQQFGRQLDGFGLGQRANEELNAAKSIYREFGAMRTDWNKSMAKRGLVGSDLYKGEVAQINASEQEALQQLAGYYDALAAKQSDWRYGALSALADYRDAAANVAASAERLFSSGFQSMEDAVAKFATTGKLNFKSFALSVIEDLARIQARAAISGLAQMGIGLLGSALSAGVGAFSGAETAMASSGTVPVAGDMLYGGSMQAPSYTSGVFLSGARAGGGPVDAGGLYLVGEEGPELFKPSGSGSIVPNHALGGGGDVTINVIGAQSQPEVRQSTDGNGNRQIDLIFKEMDRRIDDRIQRATMQGGLLSRRGG